MTHPHRCPRCDSPAPHLHPAVQYEGEVQVCPDAYHLEETPMNRPEYRRAVREARAEAEETRS